MKRVLVIALVLLMAGCGSEATPAVPAEGPAESPTALAPSPAEPAESPLPTPAGPSDSPVPAPAGPSDSPLPAPTEPARAQGMGPGRGGMQARHHAPVPEPYAALRHPQPGDSVSEGRGQAIYVQYCAVCHGDTGLGDGPAGANLDPPAAPVAHSSQMMSDGYLFWRVREGGAPFGTPMPAWNAVLDETQTWDVISYMRALGRDGAAPVATAQAARQDAMLSEGVAGGVITQAEADAFRAVHDALEAFIRDNPEAPRGMDERETQALAALVAKGTLSQAQVDAFLKAHDALDAAGLMP